MIKEIFLLLLLLSSTTGSAVIAHTASDVRAITFDFGGVIARSDRESLIQFLTDTFQQPQEQLKPALDEWKLLVVNGGSERRFWSDYATSLGIVLPEGWFDRYRKLTGFTEIPGMIAIVNELQQQGFQTPLLSNMHHFQATLFKRLDYCALFDPALFSYEIGYEKPHRKAFTFLLDLLRLSPSELIFIDDQIGNVKAAKALGIDAIPFTTPLKPCRYPQFLAQATPRNIS